MSDAALLSTLRMLQLQPDAADDEIRAAIKREVRRWRKRTDAPKLQARQEAERMLATLASAEAMLLSPQGRSLRSRAAQGASAASNETDDFDGLQVCEMIRRVLSVRGTKSRQRRRTVVHHQARLFHAGVDYQVEETVHKSYERHKDRQRVSAVMGSTRLFEFTGGAASSNTPETYLPGPWLRSLADLFESVGPEEDT